MSSTNPSLFRNCFTGKIVTSLVALWAATVPVHADGGPRICVVDLATGTAQIQRADRTEHSAENQSFGERDKILTGPTGRVHIKCADGSAFTVGANPELLFEELPDPAVSGSFIMRLSRGIAGFIVPFLGENRFEVRTPSAVASVRSTEWTVDVEDTGISVFVRKGGVDVSGGTASVLLRDGEGVTVQSNGSVDPVKTWSQTRIEDMNGRLGFDWQ